MNKKAFYIKLVAILFMSVWLSSFIGSSVFISYTPEIRKNPVEYIVKRLNNNYNNFIAKLNLPFSKNSINNQTALVPMDDAVARSMVEETKAALTNVPLQTVAKGIYAQDNAQRSLTIINTGEVESVKLTYVVDGQTITLTVPKTYYDSLGLSDEELIEMVKSGK